MKKNNNSSTKSEHPSKQAKSRVSVQRDTKEVMAELLTKLTKTLDPKAISASAGKEQGSLPALRLPTSNVASDWADTASCWRVVDELIYSEIGNEVLLIKHTA